MIKAVWEIRARAAFSVSLQRKFSRNGSVHMNNINGRCSYEFAVCGIRRENYAG